MTMVSLNHSTVYKASKIHKQIIFCPQGAIQKAVNRTVTYNHGCIKKSEHSVGGCVHFSHRL